MFAKSILAATVAGLAVAAPAPRDDPHYTLLSVHSGNEAVHQKTINFNNNTWVIGLDTTAYTPGPDYASCLFSLHKPFAANHFRPKYHLCR